MAGLSDYCETTFLNYLRGTTMPTAPTTLYIGLNSADNDAGGSEVTATYLASRASYTGSNLTAPATVSGFRETKNSTIVNIGTAIASGTAIGYFSVWDSLSGGNCLYVGQFVDGLGVAEPKSFGTGDTLSIAINGLVLQINLNGFTEYFTGIFLNWLRGTTAPAAPTTYAGLCTAVNANGTVTEVTTTVRVAGRVTVSTWDAVTTDANFKLTKNTNSIDFGNSAGTVTSLSHLALFDAASAGNLLAFAALPLARNVAIADQVIWDAQKLTIKQS